MQQESLFPDIVPPKVNSKAANPKTRASNPTEFFPTHEALALATCRMIHDLFFNDPAPRILDVCAGFGERGGVYGRMARQIWPDAYIHGVEIVNSAKPDAYDMWSVYDYTAETRFTDFNIVLGNPAFSIIHKIVPRLLDSLADFGVGALLVRQGWAGGGQVRQKTTNTLYPFAGELCLPERPHFTDNGRSDVRTDYAVTVWRKNFKPSAHQPRFKGYLWWKESYGITW